MGEKTPAHFRYVPTLLTWFPQARIIHMLRDPRGIFVSEWRRRQREAQSFPYKQLKHVPALMKLIILLQTTYTWRESARNSREYLQLYPQNYYPLRFEDLVRDPENQVKALCRFIGVEFQPEMLDQTVVSMGFQEKQTGFDAGAASRWKKQIQPWADAWLRFWLGQDMKRLGYELENPKDETVRQQHSG